MSPVPIADRPLIVRQAASHIEMENEMQTDKFLAFFPKEYEDPPLAGSDTQW